MKTVNESGLDIPEELKDIMEDFSSSNDQVFKFYSSDGRVVKVSVGGAVDAGLISSRVKPMTVRKIGIHNFPA